MKKIIHVLLCSIGVGCTVAHAQPLYLHSPFGLPELFGNKNTEEVKQTYEGKIINAFGPNADPRLLTNHSIAEVKLSPRYKHEAALSIRRTLVPFIDSGSYVVVCPEFSTSHKVVVGIFYEGFEVLCQQANGDYVYIVHRTAKEEPERYSFLSLVYEKKTHVVRSAYAAELEQIYDIIFENAPEYIASK